MKYKQIMNILSNDIKNTLEHENLRFDYLQEIRLRAGYPIILLYAGKEKILSIKATERSIRETLDYVSNYSLYAYENELKQAGISNYSLVKSSSTWGVPDTISQLQIDGKSVSPGVYFSNKDGKKLIVFYISKDASYVPQTATKATVTTASYTTGAATGVVTTQAVTQQPATEATSPPATDPPATLPPATDPPAPPPTDPPVVDPPEGGGEIEVW